MIASSLNVYESKPKNFDTTLQAAACFIEIDGQLLLLQRSSQTSETGRWGVPAGKLEVNETPLAAAQRELCEETGICLQQEFFESLGCVYIKKPKIDYVFHLFRIRLSQKPQIQLCRANQAACWASIEQFKMLPLMDAAEECVEIYRRRCKLKRPAAIVSCYLMLRKENQVLLSLRKNTGYRDGMWGLIAGHVEEGESATCAMIREAAEEAGLCLKQSDLTFVHIIHRKEDRINIDIFFDCCHWEGTLSNLEPHRCEELRWFSLNALPEHTIGTIQRVFNAVSQNITYSEEGWD